MCEPDPRMSGVLLMPVADEPAPPKTPGWHRHRFTEWGEVHYQGGVSAVLTGGGPGMQDRHCVVCQMVQRRRIDV